MDIRIFILLFAVGTTGCRAESPAATEIKWYKYPMQDHRVEAPANLIERLPNGILVGFANNPAAREYVSSSPHGAYLRHIYSVEARVVSDPVAVRWWGVICRVNGKTEHYSFSREEFIESFNCPDGALLPGRDYVCTDGWLIGGLFSGEEVTWYIVGTDGEGSYVKGEGTARTHCAGNRFRPEAVRPE